MVLMSLQSTKQIQATKSAWLDGRYPQRASEFFEFGLAGDFFVLIVMQFDSRNAFYFGRQESTNASVKPALMSVQRLAKRRLRFVVQFIADKSEFDFLSDLGPALLIEVQESTAKRF